MNKTKTVPSIKIVLHDGYEDLYEFKKIKIKYKVTKLNNFKSENIRSVDNNPRHETISTFQPIMPGESYERGIISVCA